MCFGSKLIKVSIFNFFSLACYHAMKNEDMDEGTVAGES